MNQFAEYSGEATALEAMLVELEKDPKVRSIMILSCDENGLLPEDVDPVLKNCSKPIWGGIFPKILQGEKVMHKGTVIIGFPHDVKTITVHGLSDPAQDYEDALEVLYHLPLEKKTMFVFMDGLSTRIADLKDALFETLGLDPNYIGGGAGSLSFVQKPCVFTNEGLLADAAVLALADVRSGLGVAHGWKPITEVIRVTEAENNRVISLNWKPAFDVYREIVEKESGLKFEETGFFNLAKAYPLGIQKAAGEMVIRDPIENLEDGSIVCVGEVPVNTFISIMNGNTESLLEGAAQALNWAKLSYEKNVGKLEENPSTTIFIDCISRMLFMEDDFYQELQCIQGNGPVIGALTLGEIANTGKTYLEFYNKTSVVGLMEV